jgi:FkbM family methyltransferase
MSFSIQLGNFLFKHAIALYKPMYTLFKKRQDAFEIDLLHQHIGKGNHVLDIGANIGFYANILSDIVGKNGSVHCFEPDITNFKHLQKRVQSLSNVIINEKAVGAKTEKIKIYTSKELNVDHRTYKPEVYDDEIEIEAISIDDYVLLNNIKKIDLIKIDIQGFEMQAIKGMEKTLNSNPNIKIISEFWPYGLRAAGSSLSEYFNYLVALGFDIQILHENKLAVLNIEQVKLMENLNKEHYYNIFAFRNV